MTYFTRLIIRIFSYSLSPILMTGNELPGTRGIKPTFDNLESIWVPMSSRDFFERADQIETSKKSAESIEDWENIGNRLYQLLQDRTITGDARLTVLINFAYANHFAGRPNWTKGTIQNAEQHIEENKNTSRRLVERVSVAKKRFL